MPDRPVRRADTRFRLVVAMLAVALLAGVSATVSAATVPACAFGDVFTPHDKKKDWPRTLVDTTYRLPAGYGPGRLRSTAKAGLNGGYRVRAFVIRDLRAMAAAARRSGARLAVQSAYRSYATQRATFDYWTKRDGYEVALLTSARAGHSEHQLGTTIDFRSYGGRAPWDYRDWGKTRAGRWLKRNAWKYGFVMSYPKGATSLTCYMYEPWHFRYVGREAARQIRDQGLTLREWLWSAQVLPDPTPTPSPTTEPTQTPAPTAETTPAPTDDSTPSPSPIVDPG